MGRVWVSKDGLLPIFPLFTIAATAQAANGGELFGCFVWAVQEQPCLTQIFSGLPMPGVDGQSSVLMVQNSHSIGLALVAQDVAHEKVRSNRAVQRFFMWSLTSL